MDFPKKTPKTTFLTPQPEGAGLVISPKTMESSRFRGLLRRGSGAQRRQRARLAARQHDGMLHFEIPCFFNIFFDVSFFC